MVVALENGWQEGGVSSRVPSRDQQGCLVGKDNRLERNVENPESLPRMCALVSMGR